MRAAELTKAKTDKAKNCLKRQLYRQKVKEATKNKIPKYLYHDSENHEIRRRIFYVRYADDFLLGIHGPKSFVKGIQVKVEQFLKETLHFSIKRKGGPEDEQIIHSRSNKVRFLGFDLKTPSRNSRSVVNTRKIISFKKLRNRMVNKKLILQQKYETMLKKVYVEVRNRQMRRI